MWLLNFTQAPEAIVYGQIFGGDFQYEIYQPLSVAVTEYDPDIEVWSAASKPTILLLPTIPPPSIPASSDSTQNVFLRIPERQR